MKVPVGPATITGYLTALVGFLGATTTAISGTEAQLHGPGKWMAILGLVSLGITNLGRQLQAAKILPETPETLTARPESGVKPEPI
jgi:hypothetical protein